MIIMKPGKYYIGDLCYILSHQWDEVCDISLGESGSDRSFTLSNGVEFVMFGTAYGDGEYLGSDNKFYPVDSGTIGCVLIEHVSNAEIVNLNGLGQIVEFTEPFECDDTYEGKRGNLKFGHIVIDTDPDSEPEEEEEPEYDEDEGEE